MAASPPSACFHTGNHTINGLFKVTSTCFFTALQRCPIERHRLSCGLSERFIKRQRIEATFTHKNGNLAKKIAKFAENGKVGLLVMGSHGHGALRSLVLCSAVTKVLVQRSKPILLNH